MHWFTKLRNVAVCCLLLCVVVCDPAYAADDLPNDPPEDPPFYGGYYISGYDPSVGNCTIYVPVGEGWCLDEYGFLFHCGTGSVSGLLVDEDGTEYTFNAPAYATPRYRPATGSSYTYVDLSFNPSAANVVVQNSFSTAYDPDYISQLVLIAGVGLIFVVLVSRGR